MSTSTSSFGVSRRQGHDASGFYRRFPRPHLDTRTTPAPPAPVRSPVRTGRAQELPGLADNSVALIVTSPPYFVGKEYEDAGPTSYGAFLQSLAEAFSACFRVLEPGGRIAVNVANLGRKPYRSLCADVERLLVEAGFLLRGEVVWRKAQGASGSCAWGSWCSPANPVLRDCTERIVVACKGRFDRALSRRERQRLGFPHRSTITPHEFMESTLDLWEFPPERASRVGHPAPFPVELPRRLIQLYTYQDDLVVDPFMGSGTTLVAARGLRRRYAGFDVCREYTELAKRRLRSVRPGELLGDVP